MPALYQIPGFSPHPDHIQAHTISTHKPGRAKIARACHALRFQFLPLLPVDRTLTPLLLAYLFAMAINPTPASHVTSLESRSMRFPGDSRDEGNADEQQSQNVEFGSQGRDSGRFRALSAAAPVGR